MPQFPLAASWQCAPLADRNWHATSTPIPDRSRAQALPPSLAFPRTGSKGNVTSFAYERRLCQILGSSARSC